MSLWRAGGWVPGQAALVFALACAALCACYARTVPLDEPAAALPLRGPNPQTAGVLIPSRGDARSVEIALAFARRLDAAQLFDQVVFPLSERAPSPVDVVLALQVASAQDRKPISNLFKDLAAGASLLVLQPVLPTRYDLDVEIGVDVRKPDGTPVGHYRGRAVTRFESNYLRTEGPALLAWQREAYLRAVDAAIAELLGARDELAETTAAPAPE